MAACEEVPLAFAAMLLREDDRGLLAIGQPSHAWLSGQLARAWGNAEFGPVVPFDEVCLATEQHDVGWAARDLEPIYDPEAGRPRSFMEMPLEVHLDIFRHGPRRLVSQSRYAALLVSMHGWRLYERRDLDRMPEDQARAVRDFLAEQRAFQEELLTALRADEGAAASASEDVVQRNSLLIWTWDYLSLALCLGWSPATAKRAPSAGGTVDIEVAPGADGVAYVDPWPFSTTSVGIRCEGRRLRARYAEEEEMRAAFATAPWETLELRLEPRS